MNTKGLVDDLKHTILSTGFELEKHIRNRRLLIMAIIAVAMPLVYYVLPKLTGKDLTDDAGMLMTMNLGFVNLLVIISGAVFIGDSVSGEIQNKTALLLFPTPQRRTSIFLGKIISAVIATWAVIMIYYLVTFFEVGLIFGFERIDTGFLKSFLLALLYGLSVVSVVFLLSGIMKRSISVILTGILSFFMVLPIVSKVLQGIDIEPWFLVTYSAGLITDVLGTGEEVGFGPGKHMAVSGFEPDLGVGILIMAAYILIFMMTGMIISTRRTME